MAKYLDLNGLTALIAGIKDGSLKAGYANRALATGIDGIIPLANLPQGALERLVVVANDAARFALTTAQVQAGDTVKVTELGKMYFVVDDTKLNVEAGYSEYSAGTATSAKYADTAGSVDWNNVKGKPTQFPAAPHTHLGTDIKFTGYSRGATIAPVSQSDNLFTAIGKLEFLLSQKIGNSSFATDLVGGVIKLGSAEVITSGPKVYPVQLDSNRKAFVQVPWTDTVAEDKYRPISVNGTELLGNDNRALNLVAGTNVVLTPDTTTGKVTFSTSGEANQNAFSKIKVGAVTVTASAKEDTLTIVEGSGIVLTPNAGGKTLTVSHAAGTPKPKGLYKITVSDLGHVSAVEAVTKDDIVALGIPGTDTNTDTKVFQKGGVIANVNIPVLLSGTANDSDETNLVGKATGLTYNSATKTLTTVNFAGKATAAGKADTADKATADKNGKDITLHYATKEELGNVTGSIVSITVPEIQALFS